MKTRAWLLMVLAVLVSQASIDAGRQNARRTTRDASRTASGVAADARVPFAASSATRRSIGIQRADSSPSLYFESNVGQSGREVEFLARANGKTIFLTKQGAAFRWQDGAGHLQRAGAAAGAAAARAGGEFTIDLTFKGAVSPRAVLGLEPLPSTSNYFHGNDARQWRRRVAHYGRIRYAEVYPGVAVEFYGRNGELEYDFIVAPGTDPQVIELLFQGATGLQVEPSGDLLVCNEGACLRQLAARAYQEVGADRLPVGVRYVAAGANGARFAIDAYDRTKALVIDPVVTFATHLGGAGDDQITGVAVDPAGNAYVVGGTASVDFPATIPGPDPVRGRDAFLAKYNASGALIFALYLGGAGTDDASDVAVNGLGEAFIGGMTGSGDFPTTTGAFQRSTGGFLLSSQGFVAKVAADGSGLVYSTLLGGGSHEWLTGIAIDATGQAHVTGYTVSGSSFPLQNAVQTVRQGFVDAFVTKFNAAGSALVYSTLLGGAAIGGGDNHGQGIAVGPDGQAVVVGDTDSGSFPLANAIDSTFSGITDVFVAKFTTGGALVFSTYLGGSSGEFGGGVAVDPGGIIHLTGSTSSANFPITPSALQSQPTVSGDAFITRLAPDGSAILYSTYLGGASIDAGHAIAVDDLGNAYVAGITLSNDFPLVAAFQTTRTTTASCGNLCFDVFVSKLNPAGNGLDYSSYLGGSGSEGFASLIGAGLALDGLGNAYVSGFTASANFPVVAPHQRFRLGPVDGFLARLLQDADGDRLSDDWEQRFGLSASSGDGDHGASGDPDGDGRTNGQEYQSGTHPRGTFTRYLAEGATGSFFDVLVALLNPNATPAIVLVRFLKTDGTIRTTIVNMPPNSRRTVDAETVSGLGAAEFSTVVESDQFLVVDRTMRWAGASHYGSHAETGIVAPSLVSYLAEGATHFGFDLFYLLQNPSLTEPAQVRVRYLRPTGPPLEKQYDVGPNSRFNIWVDLEDFAGHAPECSSPPSVCRALASTDVAAVIEVLNGVPIIVERAMYLGSGGLLFGAGHASAGVATPATSWFLAEGATGPFFDLFVLIANPGSTAAAIDARFLLPDGTTIVRNYSVGPNSRFNIWVDLQDPRLADTAVSTTITSTNGVPIIVERAMWWPGPTAESWHEAHNSPGATATGTRWAVAEGEVGGSAETETYLLIANTSPFAGSARVTLIFEDGTPAAVRTFALNASSRFSVSAKHEFPETAGRRFGAIVESLGGPPAELVVERAMYSNAGGVRWAAGTNALATRLP